MKELMREVVSFEKKKLVLPVLLSLVLFFAVFSGMEFRDKGYDEEATVSSVNTITDLGALYLEAGYFNDSVDNLKSRRRQVMEGSDTLPDVTSDPRWFAVGVAGATVYRTPAYLLVPEGEMVDGSQTALGRLPSYPFPFRYSVSDRYLTEELPEALVLVTYRQRALERLESDLNSTDNYTLSEFRDRIDQIKQRSPYDPEVLQAIENASAEDRMGGPMSLVYTGVKMETVSDMKNGDLKEIQWYHFVPTFVATFVTWYVLSGFLVVALRRGWSSIRGAHGSSNPGNRSGQGPGQVDGEDGLSLDDMK